MRSARNKVGIAAIALTSALVFAGCASDDSGGDTEEAPQADPNGIQDLEPDEILDQVHDAVDGATSVHLVGSQSQEGTELEMDMQLAAAGDATGSVTTNGVTIDLRIVDGTTYFSASEDFWSEQLGPELAAQVGEKFVEVPAGDESFGDFGDYDAFFADMLESEGKVEKGEESEVDGVPALILIDSDDDGELFIAMEGEPLPLKVASSAEGGELTFTDWNADVVVEAPAADEVVDLSSLTP